MEKLIINNSIFSLYTLYFTNTDTGLNCIEHF